MSFYYFFFQRFLWQLLAFFHQTQHLPRRPQQRQETKTFIINHKKKIYIKNQSTASQSELEKTLKFIGRQVHDHRDFNHLFEKKKKKN